jgi:hypothetical protein
MRLAQQPERGAQTTTSFEGDPDEANSTLDQSRECRDHEPREHPPAHRQQAERDVLPGMQSLALRVVKKSLNSSLIVISGSTLWRLAPKHHSHDFCRGPRGRDSPVSKFTGHTPRTPGVKHRTTVPMNASITAQPAARKL